MNHNFIYAAIGFILGGIAGGFFMGCYCGRVYKKKIDALEYELDEIKGIKREEKKRDIADREKKAEDHKLAKKTAEDIIGYKEYVAPEREEEEEDEDEEDFDSDEDLDFDDPFDGNESSNEMNDGNESSNEMNDGHATAGDFEDDEEDEREMIKLISKKAYNEDLQYRDSETLTYYVEDGILADAFDDPVQNAAEIIGIEAIEKAESTDEDEIYVSNDIEDKIYEIIVEHNESYYKDLMR